jgi:putative intracellular protease/amidase
MILRMVGHSPSIPSHVCGTFGTGNRCSRSGLLALVIAAGRLGTQLEALYFIEVLAERGIAVMVAATTDDMGAVGFMDGGLRVVRL